MNHSHGHCRPSHTATCAGARTRNGGFTLTELLVTMVVMGILAAIAVTSYRSYSIDSRRATAHAALVDGASRQEQFFLNNKVYANLAGAGGLNVSTTVDGGFYTLAVDAPTAGCPVARCYVLRATPLGTQTEDSCGALTYNSEGAKSPANCW